MFITEDVFTIKDNTGIFYYLTSQKNPAIITIAGFFIVSFKMYPRKRTAEVFKTLHFGQADQAANKQLFMCIVERPLISDKPHPPNHLEQTADKKLRLYCNRSFLSEKSKTKKEVTWSSPDLYQDPRFRISCCKKADGKNRAAFPLTDVRNPYSGHKRHGALSEARLCGCPVRRV